MNVKDLYRNRFDDSERAWKTAVWEILHARVFSRYIQERDVVIDVGAGYCEFINQVRAARRIAVDLNPETARSAAKGVEVFQVQAEKLDFLPGSSVDVVFTSNFLEHLPDKKAVSAVIEEMHRVLRPGGRLIAVGPNVRHLPGAYWDYFDHHVALTERSVMEVLQLSGFWIERAHGRFLPYTVKSGGPRWRWLVHAYLSAMPLSSNLFGRQFLVVARRPDKK